MMDPAKMLTQAQCRKLLEEVEGNPEDFPHWIHTETGYIPVQVADDMLVIPWEIILEHGKLYIQYVQDWDFSPDETEEERTERITKALECVGGSFPW